MSAGDIATLNTPSAVTRVALLGLGSVGRLHLAAYKTLSEIQIVALVDPVASDLDELAAACRATPYRDPEVMLSEQRPDIACVLTPALTHASLTTLCAHYGVDVLCEKPLALGVAEAEQMIRACSDAGTRLVYGASYRHLPTLKLAKSIIANGTLGDIVLMREEIIGGSGPQGRHDMGLTHYPKGAPGGSGYGMVDHGVHLIDAFMWLTQSPIVQVFGRGNRSGQPAGSEFMVATLANGAVAQLTYDDGTFSTDLPSGGVFSIGAGWDIAGEVKAGTWAEHPQTVHIYGTKGALRINHYANRLFLRDMDGLREIPVGGPIPNLHFGVQLLAMIRSDPDLADGLDGLRALKVIESLYSSDGNLLIDSAKV